MTEAALCVWIIEVCQSEFLCRHLLKKQYLLDEIEEMMRVNDQTEEHAKKMKAGKLEKREQAFRLQSCQKESQSPEHRKMPKSTNYPQQTGRRHSPDKWGQRESQLKCYCCCQDFPHTDQCQAFGQPCHCCGKENHFERVCQASQKSMQQRSWEPRLCHHAKVLRQLIQGNLLLA
ncbi:hypothetical protein NDU88_003910 [Pleurodeles waltl]|uniref:CCHC-type domain-containing protein n=1 Tax=Pleurodeles waltl TaxID=8319 RepID=A0AAV7VH53_PLEWA|nr:hypothetical protein NDU88_003910 [Pleurodeles waltl]